ncbi:hypothetical protein C8F04DRAFT_276660 [Mycena alexandri]|uniref:Uncharacterized protein n=1 Tax=Mycena alexandri TaxID=1745969 RepID=A0AAD6WQ06_9AGAR|nr:hypothetical protein C8F04DRAFT_276660 [Mycena alexandri]
MIPAFYFNLDPNDIPDENGFDPETMSPATESAIERAWSSIQSLYIIDFPLGIGTDAWPRVWQWVRFFHLFRDHLKMPIRLAKSPLSVDFLMFSGRFRDNQASYTLIKSTPAFWSMLGEAWLHITQSVDPPNGVLFADLSGFIQAPEAVEPDNLAEMIEGVGGTIHELARVATLYLALLVPRSPDVVDFIAMHLLGPVLKFSKAIDPSLDNMKGPALPLGAYGIALLSENVVPILTNGLCAGMRVLAQGGDPVKMDYIAGILWETSNLLKVMLVKSSAVQDVPMALKSGLLRAIATCAQIPGFSPLQQHLAHWVHIVLPVNLVFHGVLRALGPALEDIVGLVDTNAFRRSVVYEKWIAFKSLAQERLQILESRFFDETRSLRVCDNIQVVF